MNCAAVDGFRPRVRAKLDRYVSRFDPRVAKAVCDQLRLLLEEGVREPGDALRRLADHAGNLHLSLARGVAWRASNQLSRH